MTPAEFKAWFDGFTEAFSGTPTKAQWARIKDRVSEIDGKAVTERVYIDRYWNDWWNRHPSWTTYCTGMSTGAPTVTNTSDFQSLVGFNSTSAMYALGKADAVSLTN